MQIFTHGSSGPLVVLPELGCCSFALTLIPGHGYIKKDALRDILCSELLSLASIVESQSPFPLVIKMYHPSQDGNSLLYPLNLRHKLPKVDTWPP